jgi:phage shock protein PspC (stress-responsive transcriptional regulator)
METARPVENPAVEAPKAPLPAQSPPLQKHPIFAAVLALFPGMGNVYNGLYLRGIIFFTVIACLLALGTEGGNHPVLGFVVAFVWIFNVLDSMRQAHLINCGHAQDLGQTDLPKIPKAGQGGLLAGILLIVLGVVASLQLYFGIDLSWMIRYWPLAIIAFGAYLVAAWYREHRKREEEESLS